MMILCLTVGTCIALLIAIGSEIYLDRRAAKKEKQMKERGYIPIE